MNQMEFYKIRCGYEKKGRSKYISNKNFQKLIERTLRRANMPLRFSEGFSVRPKISFGPPLPVAVSGTNEFFDFSILEKPACVEDKRIEMNSFLPHGLRLKEMFYVDNKAPSISSAEIYALYRVTPAGIFDKAFFEDLGEMIEFSDKSVVFRARISGFSHKKLVGLLVEGLAKDVSREILEF